MTLPQSDMAYLQERGAAFSLASEANMTCLVIRAYELPRGYDQLQSDLLLRLSLGYPDVPPDMWWFDPPVRRLDGTTVQATEAMEHHLGRTWQRWSRHFNAGQWCAGIDSLESFLALIRKELERCVLIPA